MESLINESYFNLTHPSLGGIVVVLARRGAAIVDILIPYTDDAGRKQNRSIVLKGNDGQPFGSVRFGFDETVNSMNMTNQLPSNYPFFRAYNEDWSMHGDRTKPSRVRFVRDFIEVIYEFSSADNSQFSMKTIVSPPLDEQIVVDPTNNIYFNLRGYGNLSTVRNWTGVEMMGHCCLFFSSPAPFKSDLSEANQCENHRTASTRSAVSRTTGWQISECDELFL